MKKTEKPQGNRVLDNNFMILIICKINLERFKGTPILWALIADTFLEVTFSYASKTFAFVFYIFSFWVSFSYTQKNCKIFANIYLSTD